MSMCSLGQKIDYYIIITYFILMILNIRQQINEESIDFATQRLRRHSCNQTKIHRRMNSSISEINNSHRYQAIVQKYSKTKLQTDSNKNENKRYNSIEEEGQQYFDSIQILKKRRNSHFVPSYLNPKSSSEGKKSHLKVNKSKLMNSIQYNLQNKKRYLDIINKSKKIIPKFITQENAKVIEAKVFPSIITPSRSIEYHRKPHHYLSMEELKIKPQPKQNERAQLKIEKNESIQIIGNKEITLKKCFETLKEIKLKIKHSLSQNDGNTLKNSSVAKRKKNKASVYKVFPHSFQFKPVKQVVNEIQSQQVSGFSPWQSKSSQFVQHEIQ